MVAFSVWVACSSAKNAEQSSQKTRGYKGIEPEAKTCDTPRPYVCKCGRGYSRADTLRGHQKVCTGEPKQPKRVNVSILTAQQIAKIRGGQCLSDKYIDLHQPLRWQCGECDHEWDACLGTVRSRGTWCPNCANTQLALADAHEAAEQKGGKCLSSTYVNASEPLLWQCGTCDHEWETCLKHVRNDGTWCPNCLHKNEREVRGLFEMLTGEKFPQKEGLLPQAPRIRFDGYCEAFHIAFEYHGEQHYTYIPHFHRNGPEDLDKQRLRDRLIESAVLLLKEPIALIVVPHYLTKKQRIDLIWEELHLLGVTKE